MKSIGQLRKALELEKNEDPKLLDRLSEAYLNSGELYEAISCQEETIARYGSIGRKRDAHLLSYTKLAGIYNSECEFGQAIGVLNKAEKLLNKDTSAATVQIYERCKKRLATTRMSS